MDKKSFALGAGAGSVITGRVVWGVKKLKKTDAYKAAKAALGDDDDEDDDPKPSSKKKNKKKEEDEKEEFSDPRKE